MGKTRGEKMKWEKPALQSLCGDGGTATGDCCAPNGYTYCNPGSCGQPYNCTSGPNAYDSCSSGPYCCGDCSTGQQAPACV